MSKPYITAIMPTCGRTICIGESIYSFINQDYENKKLIILDTHPQNMLFDKLPDNIQYIKENSFNFRNLGEKFKYLINLVDTELFCIWEDDDIWLKEYLSKSIEVYDGKICYQKIGHKKHFSMLGGVDKPIHHLSIDANLCWCRYIFTKENLDLEKIQEPFDVSFIGLYYNTIQTNGMPQYIYRWDNGQCHMSGFYGQKSYDELYRLFEDDLSKQDISNKTIELKWRHDYQKLCEDVYNSS